MTAENRIFAEIRLLDVPLSLDLPYTYYIPAELSDSIVKGAFVNVPFGGGNRHVTGIVTGFPESCELDASKVKTAKSSVSGDVYDVTYINSQIGDIETLLQALR